MWAIGAILVCSLAVWWLKSGRPPQMGTDAEVFKTVDALFTAINGHDESALGECQRRLEAAHAADRLPDSAWDYLQDVARLAREDRWAQGGEKLYRFMIQQRADAGPNVPGAVAKAGGR